MTHVTDAGILSNMVYHAMKNCGIDAASIFAYVDMPDAPPNPNKRRNNDTQRIFWDAAEKLTGDPSIGLKLAENMPIFRGQIIEYLFLSSPTFGAGLQRALRYSRLVSESFVNAQLRVEQNDAILYGLNHPVRHFVECVLVGVLRFFEYITNQCFKAKAVHLSYASVVTALEYESIMQCPVLLEQRESKIIFDAQYLNLPSPSADAYILEIHEAAALDSLLKIDKTKKLICSIERELGSIFETGETPLLKDVAPKLGRTPRNIQFELGLLGTNFNEVVRNYREELARHLLATTSIGVDDIVWLTGFSEMSSFNRAFKQWAGETPVQYRKRKQDELKKIAE